MTRFRSIGVAFCLIISLACATTPSDPARQPMRTIPPPGIDIIEHDLTIELLRITPGADNRLPDSCQQPAAVGARALHLEDIIFKGRMTLQRLPHTRNEEGYGEQPFVVQAWWAKGYSKVLQADIRYVLSPDVKQELSSIVSEQRDEAFPVTFDFNVIFDAYANGMLVKKAHHGRPHGRGFFVIPPNGDRQLSPTIREFENCYVDVPDPREPRAILRFQPKECNDQSGETVLTLAEGR